MDEIKPFFESDIWLQKYFPPPQPLLFKYSVITLHTKTCSETLKLRVALVNYCTIKVIYVDRLLSHYMEVAMTSQSYKVSVVTNFKLL
jgi:hypothetical protein